MNDIALLLVRGLSTGGPIEKMTVDGICEHLRFVSNKTDLPISTLFDISDINFPLLILKKARYEKGLCYGETRIKYVILCAIYKILSSCRNLGKSNFEAMGSFLWFLSNKELTIESKELISLINLIAMDDNPASERVFKYGYRYMNAANRALMLKTRDYNPNTLSFIFKNYFEEIDCVPFLINKYVNDSNRLDAIFSSNRDINSYPTHIGGMSETLAIKMFNRGHVFDNTFVSENREGNDFKDWLYKIIRECFCLAFPKNGGLAENFLNILPFINSSVNRFGVVFNLSKNKSILVKFGNAIGGTESPDWFFHYKNINGGISVENLEADAFGIRCIGIKYVN